MILLDLLKRAPLNSQPALLYSGGWGARYSYLGLFPEGGLAPKQDKWPEKIGYFAYPSPSESPIPLQRLQSYRTLYRYDHRSGALERRGEEPVFEEPAAFSFSATFQNASDSYEEYLEKIRKIQEHLACGDAYQVNLSQSFKYLLEGSPRALFLKLVEKNPGPFNAYLEYEDYSILSLSPERFLNKIGNALETRPIKGTAPRGKTPEEDRQFRRALLASEKDRAELLMIVDLMRNDLGKLASVGSVEVPELLTLEAYDNVFHLLATIRAKLKDGISPEEAFCSCFPAGSVTGCPKLAAMDIIWEYEKRSRHIYTGSIGYFAGNGDFDFNVAIRTLLYKKGLVDVQLGGAITIDSDPAAEYQETLDKGRAFFDVLGLPQWQTAT